MTEIQIPRAVAIVRRDHQVLVVKRFYAGRHYAVLPGGGVEPGETFEEAAVRELWEESTLHARIDRLVLAGEHNGREARYFLMTDVRGTPEMSGEELDHQSPENSYELRWAGTDDFAALGLFPDHLQTDLPRLLAL